MIFRTRSNVTSIAVLAAFIFVGNIFFPQIASATVYQPGETLQPDCAPGSVNCGVSVANFPQIIGAASPLGNSILSIQGTTTNSILATLRAFVGQTANLLQVQDSSGSNLFSIDNAGNASFGENVLIAGTLGVTGLTTLTNASTTQLSTSGNTYANGNLILAGEFVTTKTADYVTTGAQNDVNLGTGFVTDYAGNGTATFTGLTGGVDGRQIRISNHSSFNISFTNQDASSFDANRIVTSTGGTLVIPPGSSIDLQYDGPAARWQTTSITATAATIGNFAFIQGGNGFGATATLGTTDANPLNIITSGINRFSLAAGAATLTGTGATTLTTDAGSALNVDSGTTGALNLGTGSNGKTITIGNVTDGTALNLKAGTGGINFTGLATLGNASTTLLSVSNALFVNGNATTSSNGNIATAGTLTVNGAAAFANTIGVTNLATLTGGFISSASSTISSFLNVSGALQASSTLGVSGAARFYSMGQFDGALVASSTLSATGTTTLFGNFSTPSSDYSTAGSQNDVNFGTGSFFRYTGGGTATFTGIAGGTDGRQIRIVNASSPASVLTLSNESASSAAANRITTATGADLTIPANVSVGLQYDSGTSRWRVVVLPATSATVGGFAFVQGGNGFGATATLGTTDANGLNVITSGATRFSVASGAATFTGTGATTLTTDAGSALSIIASTTGALMLDSGTTGAVNIGTSSNAKSIFIGNTTGATALNLRSGSGGVSITGSTTISSILNATNAAQLASTTLFGNTLLTNATTTAFAITGSTTVSGQFNATNGATLGALTVNGTVTLASALAVGSGGTGIAAYTSGDLLQATGATTLTRIASSTGGTILQTDFTTGRASWVATSSLGLASALIGTIGQATYFSGANSAVGTSTLFFATSGRVGVGSTSPWGLFSVNSNASVGIPQFVVGSSTKINLMVTNGGDVQIGTGGSGGATPNLLLLDVKNTSSDPTGTNGAMYYSSNLNKFRCFQNSAWKDCLHNASVDSVNDTTITSPTPGTYPTLGTSIEILTPTNPTLTPTSASSRILVTGAVSYQNPAGGDDTDAEISIDVRRGSGNCSGTLVGTSLTDLASDPIQGHWIPFTYIDSPNTTSAQAYTVCASMADGNGAAATNANTTQVMLTIQEIGAAGADVAEVYSTNDASVTMGDVVALDPSLEAGVKKSEGKYGPTVLGIVSTAPGMVIGGDSKQEGVKDVPVALSGRVPVNVSTENGPIAVGDYLTSSSVPGVAMKATGLGPVIGQALSAFNGTGVGQVLLFIKNSNPAEEATLLGESSSASTTLAAIQSETPHNPVALVAQKITDGVHFLTDFVVGRITAIRGYFDEIFANKTHQKTLCVGDVQNGGETCITKTELDSLLQSASVHAAAGAATTGGSPPPSSSSSATSTTDSTSTPPTTTSTGTASTTPPTIDSSASSTPATPDAPATPPPTPPPAPDPAATPPAASDPTPAP